MTDRLGIALGQANPTVGDIAGNLALARRLRAEAAEVGADLLVLPQGFLPGGPAQNLFRHPGFVAAVETALRDLAADTGDGGPGVLLGACRREGDALHDAAVLLDGGEVEGAAARHVLSDDGERCWFSPAPLAGPLGFRGVRLGVMVGADSAVPDVAECLQETGAELLIAVGAWPWRRGEDDRRLAEAVARVRETGLPLIMANLVGGQDGDVFGGASFVLGSDLRSAAQLPEFEESLALTDWRAGPEGWTCSSAADEPPLAPTEALYGALSLGLRDHADKNGWRGVAIDGPESIAASLLTALAADALGASRVRAGAAADGWLPLSMADRAGWLLGEAGDAELAPLGDVDRDTLGALARWRGVGSEAPGESGPDGIVAGLIEGRALADIVADGHDRDMVVRLTDRFFRAEAARRRSPPVIRVSPPADRCTGRLPITNSFREAV